jgi:hypothetical protein
MIMPYVKKDRRIELDFVVESMARADIRADGDLNYVLYKYCKNFVKPSYNNYKNFIGELHQCTTEIERRLLGPYEDIKIIENGDV